MRWHKVSSSGSESPGGHRDGRLDVGKFAAPLDEPGSKGDLHPEMVADRCEDGVDFVTDVLGLAIGWSEKLPEIVSYSLCHVGLLMWCKIKVCDLTIS